MKNNCPCTICNNPKCEYKLCKKENKCFQCLTGGGGCERFTTKGIEVIRICNKCDQPLRINEITKENVIFVCDGFYHNDFNCNTKIIDIVTAQ